MWSITHMVACKVNDPNGAKLLISNDFSLIHDVIVGPPGDTCVV